MNEKPNRDSDQFVLRFPEGMRDEIKIIAAKNHRTMNAELVFLIEKGRNAVYGPSKHGGA